MSQQSPYDRLGVAEDATFEEVQAAKQRVLARSGGDIQLQDSIEAAYDEIVMERLRLRQQGKIKVPEGIRFPEKPLAAVPKFPSLSVANSPSWLGDTFERPSQSEVLTTAGVYTVLSGVAALSAGSTILPTLIAFGTGFSLYFINQKQRRFKRALLGTLLALVLGTVVAGLLVNTLHLPIGQIGLSGETFASLLIFVLLWVTSTFTK
ncbi:MAG: CPP1-like family protein [Chamaesiphon sp.]|nr:CPP1-like family protein [Chamaesiphon sp.]